MLDLTIAKLGRIRYSGWCAAAFLALACVPGAHAQWAEWAGKAVEFAGTVLEHIPTRQELTKGVIIGVATDLITKSLSASPSASKPPGPAGNASVPEQSVPFDFCQHGDCLTLSERLQQLLPTPTRQDLRPPELIAADMQCPPGLDPNEALRRGAILDSGTDLPQRNAVWAEGCYLIAARAKMPLAEYNLGDMLYQGDEGVPRNAHYGLGWLTLAAQAGFVPAQTYVATIYEDDPLLRDSERALYWYITAAPADPAAAYALSRLDYNGVMGPNGQILPPNYLLAFRWLQISATAGFPPARQTIQAWLLQARHDAARGLPQAQQLWGMAYEYGVPGLVPMDLHLAFLDYQEAAENTPQRPGIRWAAEDLQRLCNRAPQECN